MSSSIQQRMPDAWRIFFRNRELRPIQEVAMPLALQGKSILISSPTASGKTEACFAPLYQRHVSFERHSLSVVYIAPTKALVNDMLGRLLDYFGSAGEGIIQRYTGDRHEFRSPDGAFVLLCSPEALDSLQLTKPELFSGVRAVIVDEFHFLHGTARGQQARAVIRRLHQSAGTPRDPRDVFQRVGMTATVDDLEAVARLWLGDGSMPISVGGAREIELTHIDASKAGVTRSICEAVKANASRKILVFSNTRNGAHQLANGLSDLLKPEGWPVYLHIGIMAAAEREEVEAAIRREPRALCVATSTLELGIDIGDVDAIILAEPPFSINAFLQRIGRGNRRTNKCRVWAVASDTAQRQVYEALRHCSARGFLDDVHEYKRHSVEFQQIISLAWNRVRLDKVLTQKAIDSVLGEHASSEIINDMLATGALQQVGDGFVPSQYWMDQGEQRRIHTVLAAPVAVPIIDLHSGETVATAPRLSATKGRLFTGTRTREIRAADESGFYLDRSSHSQKGLAKLPSNRRKSHGLPRRLVWALAEINGDNPKVWTYDNGVLTTWGGGEFNILLKEVFVSLGYARDLTADSCCISGFPSLPIASPSEMADLVRTATLERRIRPEAGKAYRESTAYVKRLSARLQAEEAYRAIPVDACLRWLGECTEIKEVSGE